MTLLRNPLIVFATLAVCALVSAAPLQKRQPTWADASAATVHPGVNTDTNGGSCTSNFVFYDSSNNVYIGQAAHCSGTGEATSTDGCQSGSLPEGTKINVDGASQPGTMVYNSWIRMQQKGERDANTCAYNDFALIKLDPADYAKVNPSIPKFGGPSGIRTSDVATGEPIFAFTNSVLRQGIPFLQPKYGVQTQQIGEGWSHQVLGQFDIPGDSGSGAIDGKGLAVGTLSTLALLPIPTINGFGDFSKEYEYMRSFDDLSDIVLALGTEPYSFALPIPK